MESRIPHKSLGSTSEALGKGIMGYITIAAGTVFDLVWI